MTSDQCLFCWFACNISYSRPASAAGFRIEILFIRVNIIVIFMHRGVGPSLLCKRTE
jgi:hypothetical protein